MNRQIIIINCDDFGLSKGVNDAVLEGFQNNFISSATIMVNQAYTDEALKIWKKYNDLMNIGLHFCLDMGKPLSKNWNGYLTQDGRFKRPHRESLHLVPESLIEEELRAQIKKAESLGGNLTHIDSHHHVHMVHKNVNNVVVRVARELNLPIRNDDNLIDSFYDTGVSKENLFKELDSFNLEKYKDLMCHISNEDHELESKSSYYKKRMDEKEILRTEINIKALNKRNIDLGSYKDIV